MSDLSEQGAKNFRDYSEEPVPDEEKGDGRDGPHKRIEARQPAYSQHPATAAITLFIWRTFYSCCVDNNFLMKYGCHWKVGQSTGMLHLYDFFAGSHNMNSCASSTLETRPNCFLKVNI